MTNCIFHTILCVIFAADTVNQLITSVKRLLCHKAFPRQINTRDKISKIQQSRELLLNKVVHTVAMTSGKMHFVKRA